MGIHSSFFLSHSRRGEVLSVAAETVGDFDKNAGMKKTAI